VVGGAIGNFVEWFDFGLYGYMAPVIATLFFAPGDRVAALLGTFAVFAVAFLMRPLGGVVFGHFGDKVGRRSTLAMTVILMSVATFAVGLLPTYAAIGIAAPILLLVCRLAQGFAVGGEFAGAASFIAEYAPENRRAWYVSSMSVTIFGGLLAAVALVTLLTASLGEAAMQAWGWRIPFLLALPLGLVGLYIRLRLDDTPAFQTVKASETVPTSPIREALRTQRKPMAVFFGFSITNVVAFYMILAYMPTYLGEAVGLGRGAALVSNSIALLALTVLCPVSGLLADKIGRKPMLLAGSAGFAVLTVPAFLIAAQGGFFLATLAQLLLIVPLFFVAVTQPVTVVEMFATRVRYSSGSISYNLVNMIFGGTAPLVATALLARSGNELAPAYYLVGLAFVSLLVVAFAYKETYKARLVREEDLGDGSATDAKAAG
jgi:MHS family proline/betaine transporter-like MFS transporter